MQVGCINTNSVLYNMIDAKRDLKELDISKKYELVGILRRAEENWIDIVSTCNNTPVLWKKWVEKRSRPETVEPTDEKLDELCGSIDRVSEKVDDEDLQEKFSEIRGTIGCYRVE